MHAPLFKCSDVLLVINFLKLSTYFHTLQEKIERTSNLVANAWHSNLPDAILMVDGIENLSTTESDAFRDALNKV